MASRPRPRSRSHSLARGRRSASPEDDRENGRDCRSKRGAGSDRSLPHGAQALSDEDYFVKNAEFRAWLKEEKDRFFDELSGDKARSYFRKFVKAWNRGKLSKSYYSGEVIASQRAAAQTAYRWSFAEKRTKAEQAALDATRVSVDTATHSKDPDTASKFSDVPLPSESLRPGGRRVVGPTMPSTSDRVLLREAQEEARATERTSERKRAREEDKERIEDLVGPKERGREGILERKKMKREADRAVRDAKDDALGDYDDTTLMGGGDSFQARIAQRDAARRRFEEKRAAAREEKVSTVRERQEAMREKEKATMEMFKQLAKEKFGG